MMNSKHCTKPIIHAVSVGLLSAFLAGSSLAGDSLSAEQIRERLTELFPEHTPDVVQAAPVKGLYEAIYGGEVLYVTDDGHHLMRNAELYDLRNMRNLTDVVRSTARAKILEGYGNDKMVVFPASYRKHHVTVVTDIDCPYCRMFHDHIDTLGRRGVEVRYLFYPRAGEDSESYRKSVSVWCADDSLEAMTTAKRLEPIEELDCANPVLEHMELVERIGIRSTPAIFLPDGTLVRGYRPPDELLAELESNS